MYIGNVDYKMGRKVIIKGIVDPGEKLQDEDLNGRTGRLAPKFKHIPFGQVGIYVKGHKGAPDTMVNVMLSEFEYVNPADRPQSSSQR